MSLSEVPCSDYPPTAPDAVSFVYLTALRSAQSAADDLITLTAYMAANSHVYDAGDVAYAVEKPYKYTDVLAEAKAWTARAASMARHPAGSDIDLTDLPPLVPMSSAVMADAQAEIAGMDRDYCPPVPIMAITCPVCRQVQR